MKTKPNRGSLAYVKTSLIITMKIFIFFFSILSFGFSVENGFSQDKKITFTEDAQLSMEEVLEVVKKQTDYNFIYRSDLFVGSPLVEIKKGTVKVGVLLNKCAMLTDIDFQFTDNGAIFLKKNPKVVESKKMQQTISGVVTDNDGNPLPGANIVEKGTTNGVTADFDGNYTIAVSDENATLVVSYIGFATTEVTVNGQSSINVTLEESAAGLDEVVVVGYGSQSKKKITSAVSEVDMGGVQDMPNSTSGQVLQGRVSGVTITESNGSPGQAPSIQVRGISSINAGIEPLVVIDGFPVGNGIPQSLNPNDIEKITVLKDAASTSIYGARGTNGVILIQTLKATESRSELTYNGSSGFQMVPNNWRPQTLDAPQYAQYNLERVQEVNARSGSNTPVPDIYLDALNSAPGSGTDWQSLLMRSAVFQNHNLTYRGGNSKFKGVVSAGYLNQEGVLLNTDFSRLSLRSNLDATISDWLSVGSNMFVAFSDNNSIPEDGSRGIIMKAVTASPLQSPYDENGDLKPYIPADSPGYFAYANPIFEANSLTNNRIERDINASINLDMQILPGLHYKPQLYGRLLTREINTFTPSTIGRFAIGNASNLSPGAPPFVNSGANQKSDITNWGIDNLLTYDTTIGQHSISALLGYTAQKQTGELSTINATGFPSDNTLNFLEASEVSAAVTDLTNWSLAAYFARLSYDYKSKYLAEVNFRKEGSSRFGDDNKYGNFPSASVGWRVSEESFYPEDFFMNEFKLRSSYGITGNSAIGDFDRFGTILSIPNLNNLNNNFNYVLNDNIQVGKSLTSLGSSNLKWETSKQLDLGLSMGFLRDAITLNASYFEKTTEDMLFNLSIPRASGFASTRTNIGEMVNKGVDIELATRVNNGNFSWNSNLNLSFIKNEVTYLPEEISQIISTWNVTQVGLPVGSLRGYVIDGIFNTQEQLDDPNLHGWPGAKQLGAYIYRDVDGDGSISGLDRDHIGNPHPKAILGFNNVINYKNLSLSILTTGAFGYQIIPQLNEVLYNEKGRWNVSTEFLERWRSPEDPGKGLIPSLHYPGQHAASNLWLEDGDHIWIKNVTLGYQVPTTALDKTFISSLRFHFSVQNLAKFTSYSGWNPQVSNFGNNPQALGVDDFSYPINRTYTLGVNINF
ncbi:SusC/RagA family TonB-linked outer membrane protein [Arenibacter palladensis]|uniref:SusC/RagA family TonB-linked outer membrane protein n=1 Tax=Arenibacter palladensis TaxID=237373 RepID=UPI0026E32BD5|nr:TonB-dependent receptor [Arenibacter palladensis]MDO6604390.1 TonB-dependent receptor [Arenibacter palladensis]